MSWIVLAMVVALQSAAPPAQRRADSRTWYQAYADGRRAFQQGNWQAAIDSLEVAKQAPGAPKPGRRIPFYGDVYDDYIPDYYLGLAYFNLKQYAAADRALDAMRASGVIGPRDREYAQLDQQSKAAKVALQAANAPVQTIQQQPQTPTNTRPANTANANGAAPNVDPPPSIPVSNANATAPPVETQAGSRGTPPPANVAQTGPLTNANTGARPPSAAPTTPPGYRPAASAAGSARPTPSKVTPAAARAISPQDEQAAVTAYLSGQYDRTAQLLAAATGATSASPRATFYLACSRAALVILGQADAASLAEARAALTRAGGAAQFAADRRYISPRVLQLVEARQ